MLEGMDVTREGASDAPVRILLAHGAGAGMDHAFLAELSRLLAGPDIEVVRFNFPYMSKRALDGKRRPPDRQPVLLAHWRNLPPAQWTQLVFAYGSRTTVDVRR